MDKNLQALEQLRRAVQIFAQTLTNGNAFSPEEYPSGWEVVE